MRLGVRAALVNGQIVPGDVTIDRGEGTITGIGVAPAGRGLAVPGFVDLQVNGYAGVDFLAADVDAYRTAQAGLARSGVTSFQPTLITASPEATIAALRVAARARQDGTGPRILGVHLEGPFITAARRGAHPAEHIRPPDRSLLASFMSAGPVSHVTLAPELPGADALIDDLLAAGVVVACGHSDATAAQAARAFRRGARAATHIFNAMRPFHHRDAGIAGTALTTANVVVTAIADGIHLDASALRLVFAAAGTRTALISDAIAAAGGPLGAYSLGDQPVTYEDGEARTTDGALAGSVTDLHHMLLHVIEIGIPVETAIASVTSTPAALVGRPDLGTIAPGHPADIVVLDDEFGITTVLLGGAEIKETAR